MKRNAFILILALLGANALAGERIDEALEVSAPGTVSVENMAGSVTVSVWDRNAVRVEGELDDHARRLDFETDGGFTRIKVVYPRGSEDIDGTHLDISVPAASRLDIDGVSTDVDVHGVSGRVRVDTVSGDISADGAASDYALESISGNIRLRGAGTAKARIEASTISGDIRIDKVAGELDVESVSGNLQVSDSALARIEAANTSGDIDITGTFTPGGSFGFNSISGDITLHFGDAPAGIFDVTTFSGGIDNDFGPKPQRTGKYAPGMELKFRQGGDDVDTSFRVNTLSGDISLRTE